MAGGRAARKGGDPVIQAIFKEIGVTTPTVAYVGAASDDDSGFYKMISQMIQKSVDCRFTHPLLVSAKADLNQAKEMLQSAEYGEIKQDYDRISRTHFPGRYFYPDQMSFANSDALFPPADLSTRLKAEYDAQCRMLCYGSYPSWEEVLDQFLELRKVL